MRRNGVDFKFRRGKPAQTQRQEAEFRGFFAERAELSAGSGFDFRWQGSRHYLALHDIRLKDGEARLDDATRRRVLDLRQKLTFAPQGSTIKGWSVLEDRPNRYIAFTFDHTLLEEEYEQPFRWTDPRPLLYFNDASLAFTLGKMEHELGLASPDKLYLETMGLWTALEIERLSRGGILDLKGTSGRLSPGAERLVRDYIQAQLAKDFSLSELASVAGLSRFHFSRSFRNTFGLAPRQYLLWSRVEQAKALMDERGTELAELSSQLGFADPARLSAAFKRYAGCTIGQYRRRRAR